MYFKKCGHKVSVVPLSNADGEAKACPNCTNTYSDLHRKSWKCTYVVCDHHCCFQCFDASKLGCTQCIALENIPPRHVAAPSVSVTHNQPDGGTQEEIFTSSVNQEDEVVEPIRLINEGHRVEIQLLANQTSSGDPACMTCSMCCLQCDVNDKNSNASSPKMAKYLKCGHVYCANCIVKLEKGCSQCAASNRKRMFKRSNRAEAGTIAEKSPLSSEVPRKKTLVSRETTGRDVDNDDVSILATQFKCRACNIFYSRAYSLERHVENSHRDIIQMESQNNGHSSCCVCKIRFESNKHSRHRRATYIACGHSLCLGCVILQDMQCSQCPSNAKRTNRDILPERILKYRKLRHRAESEGDDKEEFGEENGYPKEGGRFVCLKCDFTFSRQLSFERHLGKMHGVELKNMDEEEKKEDEDEYCPECQEKYGSNKDNPKTEYSSCGHVSCLQCVWKAELGCGQCITEKAAQRRTTSSPSGSLTGGCNSRASLISDSQSQESVLASVIKSPSCFENYDNAALTKPKQLEFKSILEQPKAVRLVKRSRRGRPKKIQSGDSDDRSSQESMDDGNSSLDSDGMVIHIRKTSRRQRVLRSSSPSDVEEENSEKAQAAPRRRAKPLSPLPIEEENDLEWTPGTKGKRRQPRVPKQIVLGYGAGKFNLASGKLRSPRFEKFRCIHCSKTFPDHLAKRDHLQKYHEKERPHQCQHCKWRCRSRNDLERHILKHTKLKPHKCTICEAAFTRKFTLHIHYKRVHSCK